MLDIGKIGTDKEQSECSVRDFMQERDTNASTKILRKFINSAIYIEKPLHASVSSENCSIARKNSSDDFIEAKTKRCTCSLSQKACPCHLKNVLTTPTNEKAHTVSSGGVSQRPENNTKISHAFENSCDNINQKNRVIKKSNAKEREEKKKKDIEAKKILEVKTNERKVLLEQERHNFKKWLMNKRKREIEDKKKKEKELEQQEIQKLEKEKRQLENELNFQLWLKKKEEADLEKKIQEQIGLISELERREKQLKDNERAFNEWLKNSKNRQKPVPLNRGLQSMRSSTSVAYVNPTPWNPAP